MLIFHAGTERHGETLVSSGGRVIAVCGLGAGRAAALERAYAAIAMIDWPQGFYRRDIGAAVEGD